jgi:signal transduction histidine kinase
VSGSRTRRIVDIALPIVVALFLLSLIDSESADDPAWLTALAMLAAVVQGAALWWRRSHPVIVFAIALAGGLVIHFAAPSGVFPFAGMVAITTLTALRPLRVSLPALAVLEGLTALNFTTGPAEDAGFAMGILIVPWALGEVLRNRRSAIEQESRRAVADEQARIARELHDVIAHSVSVIVVQAAAADDVFDERPDQARAALRSIESAGREALVELRRLLGGVRPGDEAPDARPGLDRLAELAAPLRAAGLEVTLRTEGPADVPVPAGVDLSAYRIVQEALTNTLRHAGASRAEVTVRTAAGMLELEVLDDGHGALPAVAGAGRGIAGMRERTALLGGTLDAGSLPGGGFRVRARLPLEQAR